MKTFLQQVASHYAATPDALKDIVFVLPNRRSSLYLRRDIRNMVSEEDAKRVRIVSINDFFQVVNGVETSGRIKLLLVLYGCYQQLNTEAESLDEFLHWGNVMLSDFDNVDKYLVDAGKLFCNVADFREMEQTFEFLTEEQRRAIEHFVSHFRDRNGRLTVNMNADSKDVKARFLKIWNLLGPLYASFKDALKERDLAYEGMVYRSVAETLLGGGDIRAILSEGYHGRKKFVFVGLNALNECEKVVLRSVRDAHMAEFVWDFSSKEIRDARNRASFFLKKNVEEFPQAFVLDRDGLSRPKVTVVGVSSSVGQTKLAPTFLSETSGKPEETVFVLPDENLLMPLLSAVPEQYDTINITMGYPVDKSAIHALVRAFESLQLTMRVRDGKVTYYHKAVSNIFSCGLFKALGNEEDMKTAEKVKSEAKQYVPLEDLVNNDGRLVNNLFAPITLEMTEHIVHDLTKETFLDVNVVDVKQNAALGITLIRLLKLIATILRSAVAVGEDGAVDADMEMDFTDRYIEAVESLMAFELPLLPSTWLRVLDGLVRSESVPFEGDALKGLQVMGTLETRALDFENICIMSVNEDLFPHRSADSSFIPPELRKGFGMPTTEFQDAVWAYYFYRLLQRAKNVWLVYDTRKEGLLSGEESRYIKQLRYHFRFPLDEYTAVAPLSPVAEDDCIEKTQADIDALKAGHLSASSLQSYLYCPAKFYYQAVKRLNMEDEVAESLDAAMIGTIFHEVMQKLYSEKRSVSVNDLRSLLADENAIRSLIKEGILTQMRGTEVEGRNLVVEEVILEYVNAALRHDLDLLIKSGSSEFRILGLERYVKTTIEGFLFIGFIDRIDTYRDGEVRIVDYKTGHVENDDINITDANAHSIAEKLFGKSNVGRPKIALQMYLYGKFANEGILHPGEKLVNSIYATSGLMTSPLNDVPESPAFVQEVDGRIKLMLDEIADTSTPWQRTQDRKSCEICDFRSICGR